MSQGKKNNKQPSAVVNRRAGFDYSLGEELVAGVVLNGRETRAARDGHVQLKGSYVNIRNDELWLNNASFSLKINDKGVTATRTVDSTPRKLLASRKQIDKFQANKQAGMSIVPLRMLTKGRYIKIVIALGKGKKQYDKRETIKKRDTQREIQREFRRQK